MTRLFLLICASLVVGGFLLHFMQQGSGYILLVWGNTSFEMNLWFGLFVIFVLVLLMYVTIKIVRGIFSTRQKIMGYSYSKAQQKTTSGLIDFIEEDFSSAYKKLSRSAKNSATPVINCLAAAQCANVLGDEKNALHYLTQAQEQSAESSLAVALMQTKIHIANEKYQDALILLNEASKTQATHSVVLQLKKTLYVALNDWVALKKLVPKLHHQNIGTLEERNELEQTLYRSLLEEQANATELSNEEKLVSLKDCWNSLPALHQKNVDIVVVYAQALIQINHHDAAETLLANSLQKEWHDEWVTLYGLLETTNGERALKNAEIWQKKTIDNPVLLLTLGRLCLRNTQWGRAKDFFKESLALEKNVETYAELARLYHFLGEEKESQAIYQQSLLTSVKSLSHIPALDH